MIPEDVMIAAQKCAEIVCRNLDYDDCSIEIDAIARAIMAERERCASAVRQIPVNTTGELFILDQAVRAIRNP